MLLARLSSWLELKLVSLPFSFLKRDPRLLGTVLLEEKVEDEAVKEEVDGDVAAIQEGVRA